MWVNIQDGLVREITKLDPEGRYHPSLLWVDIGDNEQEVLPGWTAVEKDGAWIYAEYVPPPPTSDEILAENSVKLQAANQLAAAQKIALTNRIGVINDAVEFEEATQAELNEIPIRQAQLTAWKRYAVLLGRVTTQAGWHESVEWPYQPTEGMDLSVSAVSGRPVAAN